MIRRYLFWSMTYMFIFLTAYKIYQMKYLGGLIPLDNFQFLVFSLAAASLSANKLLQGTVMELYTLIRELRKNKREQ